MDKTLYPCHTPGNGGLTCRSCVRVACWSYVARSFLPAVPLCVRVYVCVCVCERERASKRARLHAGTCARERDNELVSERESV